MNADITAVTNQRGGVGKTTTTVNLGVALAMPGKKVLSVGGDPQGSFTISMGYRNPGNLPITLPTVIIVFGAAAGLLRIVMA